MHYTYYAAYKQPKKKKKLLSNYIPASFTFRILLNGDVSVLSLSLSLHWYFKKNRKSPHNMNKMVECNLGP
jgi:hypothetical protein